MKNTDGEAEADAFKKLVLYITHQEHNIVFAKFDTRARRDRWIARLSATLNQSLLDTGTLDIESELEKKTRQSPFSIVEDYIKKNKNLRAVFITGLEAYLSEGDRMEHFNFSREAWFRFKKILVFWLPTDTTMAFRKRADDFFSWIQVVFDFTGDKSNTASAPGTRGIKGMEFEQQVAALFRSMGFEVEVNRMVQGIQIDMILSKATGSLSPYRSIVECKNYRVSKETIHRFQSIINAARGIYGRELEGIIVSGEGFTLAARQAANAHGIECKTFEELKQSIRGN